MSAAASNRAKGEIEPGPTGEATFSPGDGALGRRIAKGAGLMIAGQFAVRTLGILSTVILARLLTPTDFGLIAIVVSAMQLLNGFTDIGIAFSVIKFQHTNKSDLDTLFTLSFLRGLFVAAILIALGPFASEAFDDDRLVLLFLVISLCPLVTGLQNPRFFEFERKLQFSPQFWAGIASKTFSVGLSIAIAVAFRTYWALIAGVVAATCAQTAFSYVIRPYHPRLTLKSFGKVGGFTGWVTGISFVAALNNKIDVLIIAKIAGQQASGIFNVGVQLTEMASNELSEPIARALYPGFAAMQETKENMRLVFLRGVEAIAFVSLPCAIGAALVAEPLIALAFGEKWRQVSGVIEILAPAVALQSLFLSSQYFAMAQGRAVLIFWRELIFFFVRTPLIIYGAIHFGLLGAATAYAAAATAQSILNCFIYQRITRRPFVDPIVSAQRSLLAVATMAIAVAFMRAMNPTDSVLFLLLTILVGAIVYCASAFTLWRWAGRPRGAESRLVALTSALFTEVGVKSQA